MLRRQGKAVRYSRHFMIAESICFWWGKTEPDLPRKRFENDFSDSRESALPLT